MIYFPNHPRANPSGHIYEHTYIAEKSLGHYLPHKAQIHHFDENTLNNKNDNLIICENQAYHRLLHMRHEVLKINGDPNIQKICSKCKQLKLKLAFNKDLTTNRSDGLQTSCRDCSNEYNKIWYKEKCNDKL